MDKTKDSGIEWVGNIPENWKVIPLKYVVSYNGETLTETTTEDFEFDYVDIGSVVYGQGIKQFQRMKFKNAPSRARRMVVENDVILSTVRTYLKATAKIPHNQYPIIVSTGFITMRANDKIIFTDYLQYAIQADYFISEVERNSKGISYPAINASDVVALKIVVPPLFEQKEISCFLNKKIYAIDSVIDKTKATIEDYKKYKQAIITEVITKGLNQDIAMKDSEIEWVGKIPAHWKIKTISQLFVNHKRKNVGMSVTNLLSLSYGKIKRKDINANDGLLPESFDGYNIVEKNDIVLRLTDLQNDHRSLRVGYVQEQGIITSAYVTLRCREDIDTRYFYYYLHTFDIHKGFYGMGAGVRQGLNFDELRGLKVIIPNIEERQNIVEYLDVKCAEIDKLIASKESLVEELEAYKKSVIYEYVTGKKEVV